MSAIQYVIRDDAGITQRGAVIDSDIDGGLNLAGQGVVSLNLRRVDVRDYVQAGNNLELYLADGRRIVLKDFYDENGGAHLFLNEGGTLLEATIEADGHVSFVEAAEWGKWSQLDALVFPNDPVVVADAVDAVVSDAAEEVTMAPALGAGLLGLGGGGMALPAAGLAAAGIAGATLLGGGDTGTNVTGSGGSSGGGGASDIVPTVDNVGETYTFSGDSDLEFAVTGTGAPGATVDVVVGSKNVQITVAGDGHWGVVFAGDDFPEDGSFITNVTVTNPSGTVYPMAGPGYEIDTTPPELDIAAVEGDDIVNAAEMDEGDGVLIQGVSEPGASLVVTIGEVSYETVAGATGGWSVTFAPADFPEAEYDAEVVAVATDSFGNATTTTSMIHIDTYGVVTLTPGTDGGRDVVNQESALDGVELAGTTQPGSSVSVNFDGVDYAATVSSSGAWSLTVPASAIAVGKYDVDVTVTATDAAGNINTASDVVHVDTEIGVAGAIDAMGGRDGVVNYDEAQAGVTLTGTTEAGNVVTVQIGQVTLPATVLPNGEWSVNWPYGTLPSGEKTVDVTITATDDAGNTVVQPGTLEVDTLVTNYAIDMNTVLADGVVAGPEMTGGLTLTGTTEPGSTVSLTMKNVTVEATVAANGSWSATFPQGSIPNGDYTTTLTATTEDAAGNVDTLTESVRVDTVAGNVALSSAPIEGNDIINYLEHSDGVIVSGTATPGATVTVTFGDAVMDVVATNGTWNVDFPTAMIPAGTYDTDITASITDPYGNVQMVSDTVHVDTELPLAMTGPVEGDDMISGAEAANGVTLTGMVDPEALVSVKMGLVTHSAQVAADGTWTATFSGMEVPSGEKPVTITVTATDPAGNTEMLSHTVEVDTLVNELSIDGGVTADNVLNASEASMGLTLTGTVEEGSTVVVDYEGTDYNATVDGAGNWSLNLNASQIGTGDFTANVVVHAEDAVGNTATTISSFDVDTVAPDATYITGYTRGEDESLKAFTVRTEDDDATLMVLESDGTVGDIAHINIQNPLNSTETILAPSEEAPDGSHLLVTRVDAAGNSSTNLLALEETGSQVIDLTNGGLDDFNIDAIDLREATQADLTISADLLEGLSSNSNTLAIHGSADDTVNIDLTDGSSFASTGATVTIGSNSYGVYTLGDEGGTLIIDDDITIVT